ncbi:hypothetical protein [Cupriavidus necator]
MSHWWEIISIRCGQPTTLGRRRGKGSVSRFIRPAIYADYLFSSAVEPEQAKIRPFVVAASAPGVKLDDDWEGFGQKLTSSGTAVFDRVRVPDADLFEVRSRADDGQPKLYGFTFH